MNVSGTNEKQTIYQDVSSNLTLPPLESDASKFASYTKQQIEILTRAPKKVRRELADRGQRMNIINANYHARMNEAIARGNLGKRTHDEMLNEGQENYEDFVAPRRIVRAPRHTDENLAPELPPSENKDVERPEKEKKA